MNWRKRQIGRDDGDLIQFQFDQVLSRRGGHFSPRKSTRWSRNSEILQAQESFPHGGHIRPDEYLCSSRDIAVVCTY